MTICQYGAIPSKRPYKDAVDEIRVFCIDKPHKANWIITT